MSYESERGKETVNITEREGTTTSHRRRRRQEIDVGNLEVE